MHCRRIQDTLRQSGIDWEPDQWRQPNIPNIGDMPNIPNIPNITWSPFDRNRNDQDNSNKFSSWGRPSQREYDADITWEDENKVTRSQKPQDSQPDKSKADRKKSSGANWGNSAGMDDSDSMMSDDLGLVSAPDDSIVSGNSSDADENRRNRR